ncbi:Sulfotransferase 1 family member D1 [Holothuria leucospilota]|uniref:Sulfotransferase 1 family member D1 n=1 Tax=Holothuria leucospilota TaxID=206669 RepID=A0A9Q1BSD4_HOLLE|nr:Sulfotransferase 1 family member D1 [Holothuria leucospilota]
MSIQEDPVLRYYKGPTPFFPLIKDAAIDAVRSFTYREDDILVATYPKCGTHFVNEVIQLMIHDGDPTKLDHRHRRICLEIADTTDFSKVGEVKSSVELVDTDPSPRVLMTHLCSSYLSNETWQKRIPIVYVFRDPRDAVLSYYEFMKHFQLREGEPFLQGKSFEQYLSEYIKGKVPFGGWCEHALSYEERFKNGENILFIYYEDMKKDLSTVIKKIAKHISRPVSDDVIGKTLANSTVDAMRQNYTEANKMKRKVNIDLSKFIKTGVSGNWKKDHSEQTWKHLNEIFREMVKDTQFAKTYFD